MGRRPCEMCGWVLSWDDPPPSPCPACASDQRQRERMEFALVVCGVAAIIGSIAGIILLVGTGTPAHQEPSPAPGALGE